MPRRKTGPAPADVLVIFGITGDLARVMTFHSLYRLERRGLLDCPIVGVAVDHWNSDDLRKQASQAIEATGEDVDPEIFDRFAARLSYLPGVEDRGHFYDPVGALRDVVVNHLMHVVAGGAMEPPAGRDPNTFKNHQGGKAPTPYEVLIHAALVGNDIRFTRQDGISEQWRIMQPLLDKASAIHPYAPGTWGPEAADKLTAGVGGWHGQWVVES